ncbi:hypothetical protein FACS1894110_24600 [Spirochaetia bacterium]|nr:hypothetical protein FACS1894110_24600 [Spirochaetia bacterium]
MADYSFRGLEINSEGMWSITHIKTALNFMEKYGLNGLVIHENAIIDSLTWPEEVYSTMEMLRKRPVPMIKINANRIYFNLITRLAREKNIDFFLEAKEISFPDQLLEMKPGLQNTDGSICPTNPFWVTMLESKVRELLHWCPDLAGIIVSLGTHESRISLARNTCTCDRCKKTDPTDWYETLIRAMYKPLSEHGKKLIVRDFSYTAYHQDCQIEAASRVSKDIIISLKTTAHDFYIPYPTNSRIGHTHGHDQWIEYDVWGQFYGDAIYPASMAEDLQLRMRECKDKGVSGIYCRTDWEAIKGLTIFNSPNLLNMIAVAMLGKDLATDLDAIYKSWADNGILSPLIDGWQPQTPSVPSSPDAWKKLRDFMRYSWQVMHKTHYCRDHNYIENGQVPDHLEKEFEWMIGIHGQDDWTPGSSRVLDRTDENLAAIFEEKDWALREVKKLPKILDVESLGLPKSMEGDLKIILRLYEHFVYMAKITTSTVFLAQKALETRDKADIKKALDTLPELYSYTQVVEKEFEGTSYPHYVYGHLEPSRMVTLAEHVKEKLAEIK